MKEISCLQRKEIIIDFLKRCNDYADSKKMVLETKKNLQTEDKQKISEWEVYKRYNEVAIGELKSQKIDHWFHINENS